MYSQSKENDYTELCVRVVRVSCDASLKKKSDKPTREIVVDFCLQILVNPTVSQPLYVRKKSFVKTGNQRS